MQLPIAANVTAGRAEQAATSIIRSSTSGSVSTETLLDHGLLLLSHLSFIFSLCLVFVCSLKGIESLCIPMNELNSKARQIAGLLVGNRPSIHHAVRTIHRASAVNRATDLWYRVCIVVSIMKKWKCLSSIVTLENVFDSNVLDVNNCLHCNIFLRLVFWFFSSVQYTIYLLPSPWVRVALWLSH